MTDKKIIELLNLKGSEKILDIGGSMNQHNQIKVDTLADMIRPEEAPYGVSKLKAENFVRVDITRDKLPFKDKEFDVCLCTHTLEDLPSPFLVIAEMERVAKRGIIITPSMGFDCQFTKIDYTDWLTGARRVPGEAHHKWFFINRKGTLEIIPKNYPILYTSEFQMKKWLGEKEMVFVWKNKIKYMEFISLNIHSLIDRYKSFYSKNKKYVVAGRVLYFTDSPLVVLKALLKIIFKRGWGYSYRKRR